MAWWHLVQRCLNSFAPMGTTSATIWLLLFWSKLASTVTRTLDIPHVPDDMAEGLERLAKRAGVPCRQCRAER